MSKVIIYKNQSLNVSVVYPTEDYVKSLGIDFIARKDVPFGTEYKVVDKQESGEYNYDAYDVPTGIGGDFGSGSDWSVIGFEFTSEDNVNAILKNEKTQQESVVHNIRI